MPIISIYAIPGKTKPGKTKGYAVTTLPTPTRYIHRETRHDPDTGELLWAIERPVTLDIFAEMRIIPQTIPKSGNYLSTIKRGINRLRGKKPLA
jgi:hypothetical protein